MDIDYVGIETVRVSGCYLEGRSNPDGTATVWVLAPRRSRVGFDYDKIGVADSARLLAVCRGLPDWSGPDIEDGQAEGIMGCAAGLALLEALKGVIRTSAEAATEGKGVTA